MKFAIVLAALAAVAVARPQNQLTPGVVPILDFQESHDEFGQFALSYLTGDGTQVSEQGALVPNSKEDGFVLVKKGSFKYYAPDGQLIEETWTADGNGFHAEGSHLPVAPDPIAAS
ncbi:endocuticle structural glycoprotein SgAbd-8-like [Neodiprion fabricii]|uniref:endocuticle structural glycoprotein SgAbd-8-like n=1 Tax=Neodiprion fabricii TaxID=2872261 RepID=UPI001ED8F363|nr:endocuticle structural glycoprotein SgAbd-8-like [Neodiprion fabricii]